MRIQTFKVGLAQNCRVLNYHCSFKVRFCLLSYLLTSVFLFPGQTRSMDPTKDLAVYGYGSVSWKDRVETWKRRQDKMQVMRSDGGTLPGGKDGDPDGNGPDGPDLPLYAKRFSKSYLLHCVTLIVSVI